MKERRAETVPSLVHEKPKEDLSCSKVTLIKMTKDTETLSILEPSLISIAVIKL